MGLGTLFVSCVLEGRVDVPAIREELSQEAGLHLVQFPGFSGWREKQIHYLSD